MLCYRLSFSLAIGAILGVFFGLLYYFAEAVLILDMEIGLAGIIKTGSIIGLFSGLTVGSLHLEVDKKPGVFSATISMLCSLICIIFAWIVYWKQATEFPTGKMVFSVLLWLISSWPLKSTPFAVLEAQRERGGRHRSTKL